MVGGGFWAMNGLNSSIGGGRLGEIVGPRQLGVNQKEEQDEIRASKIWKAIEKMNTLNYTLRLILIKCCLSCTAFWCYGVCATLQQSNLTFELSTP